MAYRRHYACTMRVAVGIQVVDRQSRALLLVSIDSYVDAALILAELLHRRARQAHIQLSHITGQLPCHAVAVQPLLLQRSLIRRRCTRYCLLEGSVAWDGVIVQMLHQYILLWRMLQAHSNQQTVDAQRKCFMRHIGDAGRKCTCDLKLGDGHPASE